MLSKYRVNAVLCSLLAVATVSTGAAYAMTSGTPADGTGHPATVALLRSDGYWASPFCSGVMISGKVVLTASHCVSPALYWQNNGYEILITNDPTLQQDANGRLQVDTLVTKISVSQLLLNPAYDFRFLGGYGHDVSAAVLETPLVLDPAAIPSLPPVGILDLLRADKSLRSASFTVLGYGREEKTRPANTWPTFPVSSERRVGVLSFNALDKTFIHQSQSLAQGEDGACNGDSGGPSLLRLGATDYVVGVTSSGDRPCVATNTATRTDTAEANAFLTQVLAANPD